MTCFMFPGQPLAAESSFPRDAEFEAIAALTAERAAVDLETLSWIGEPHGESALFQVYGCAASLYRHRRLRREGVVPEVMAEHSMGIYAALAAAGSIPEGESLEIVFRTATTMARMAPPRTFLLGCVVGLTVERLLAVAENCGVYLANHNTSRHFLVSGTRENVEEAMAEAVAGGAFSARSFPCDAPLHTPLMEAIAPELAAIFADYHYRDPQVPLLDHIEQDFLTEAEIPGFMTREILLPVYWENSYRSLRSRGVHRFVEVGAGDSLKKYNRWIDGELAGGR